MATEEEAIFLRLETGPEEWATINLTRAHYRDGDVGDDGTVILRGASVELHRCDSIRSDGGAILDA